MFGSIYYGYNITSIVEETMNPEVYWKIHELLTGRFLDGDADNIQYSPIYVGMNLGEMVPDEITSFKNVIKFVSENKNEDIISQRLELLKNEMEDIEEDVEIFATKIKNLEESDRDIFIVWDRAKMSTW